MSEAEWRLIAQDQDRQQAFMMAGDARRQGREVQLRSRSQGRYDVYEKLPYPKGKNY